MAYISAYKDNRMGHIHLDRPEALNALNLEMVNIIKQALLSWLEDDDILCVIFTSSSARAFCAGGDVREAVSLIKENPDLSAEPYFEAEYGLDILLASYPKPTISLVDGIVMGGGLGLARLSKYMVISTAIKCAMPETAIGLFPDVGASKFLRRMPEAAALMMGMTGAILNAGDVIRWGLADFITSADDFENIIDDLRKVNRLEDSDIKPILTKYQITPPQGLFAPHIALIETVFNHASPQEIAQAALTHASDENDAGKIASSWSEALTKRSPTSITLFWTMIRRLDEPESVIDAIQRDFHLACKMMRRSDFTEGVRAVLIDKDNQPQWQPAHLAEVDEALLASLSDFRSMPLLPLPSFLLKTNN